MKLGILTTTEESPVTHYAVIKGGRVIRNTANMDYNEKDWDEVRLDWLSVFKRDCYPGIKTIQVF